MKDETVEVIFMYGTKDIGEDRVVTGNGKPAPGYSKGIGTHGMDDAGADNF